MYETNPVESNRCVFHPAVAVAAKPVTPAPRPGGPERRAGGAANAVLLALVLDEIDYGMFLVDEHHHIQHANRAAHAQLRSGCGLVLEGSELRAMSAADTPVWNAAVKAAATKGLRRMVMLGTEPDRAAVAVMPLPAASTDGAVRVLLLLSRRQICEDLSAHGFARDHGLSSAEGQVFRALCRGMEPAEVAAVQGVALSTVRTQIANIRLKTEASSIRELVQRVAQLPPMVSALRSEAPLAA